jgi:hypothetical protein
MIAAARVNPPACVRIGIADRHVECGMAKTLVRDAVLGQQADHKATDDRSNQRGDLVIDGTAVVKKMGL